MFFSLLKLGEKLLQNNHSLQNLAFGVARKLFIANMAQFFCLMQKKAPIMQMQILANYVDLDGPHPVRCPVKSGKDISSDRTV